MTQMQEALIEDRPMGFIFSDHWIATRYITYNVLDYDYKSLQEYVDGGLAEAVGLQLEPVKDERHAQYVQTNGLKMEGKTVTVPAVKFTNIIRPGQLICFHLVRYGAGRTSPRLAYQHVEYGEELRILGIPYRLQSVVVHEAFGGFGNAGHYYTIARTQDEREHWVELNDDRVTVVGARHAISKTATATLLFYSRREDTEKDEADAQVALQQPILAGQAFIQRDRTSSNLLRGVIQDSLPFSHDFIPATHHSALYHRYRKNCAYSQQTVRQALAIKASKGSSSSHTSGVSVESLLPVLEGEARNLATLRLLERFPRNLAEINQALDRFQGNYQKALLYLLPLFE